MVRVGVPKSVLLTRVLQLHFKFNKLFPSKQYRQKSTQHVNTAQLFSSHIFVNFAQMHYRCPKG